MLMCNFFFPDEPDDEMGKNKIFYYFLLKTSIKRELSLPNKNVT